MSRKRYQAKYFQENKDKILAKRREKRLKDLTAGQKELFSESAAQPSKVKQQTVDNLDEANEFSISNVEELFPVKTELTNEYAMVGNGEIRGSETDPRRTTWAQHSSQTVGIARDISYLGPVRISVAQAKVDSLNPTKVDRPVVDSNARSVDRFFVDHRKVDSPKVDQSVDQSYAGKEDTLESHKEEGRRPLSYFFVSAGILVLLAMNTFFLIAEQFSLYQAMGYGLRMAVLISVLTEGLLIGFSVLTSWTNNWLWKSVLLTCCVLTCFVVVNILESSVNHRGTVAAEQSGRAERLKKSIASLEKLEATALAVIERYDPKTHPTKIKSLMAELEAPGPEGYSRRLREASKELTTLAESSALADITELLLWQRRAMMFVNLILSGYLGFLLKGCVRRKAMQ